MVDTRNITAASSVLIVAAHPDDEVLGCGGTAARFAAEGHAVHILLLADGESARQKQAGAPSSIELIAARAGAAQRACAILGGASVEQRSLPDNRMDGVDLLDVVQIIETQIERRRPHMVLTHHAGDVNVDHRIVHDAVLAACRPLPGSTVRHLLFFETPSSTEWRPPSSGCAFVPNWFVDISATLEKKVEALRAYSSEMREFPHARSIEAIRALARWRGATVGVEAAEAFILGRALI
ncbi:MAG: PIG-L deacetylase family protein [Steroidobacteraceae bacterium]